MKVNLILYSLLVLFGFLVVYTQTKELNSLYLVEKGILLDGEFIRDIPENYDVNGKLAAGLLVVSDLTGLSYSSNNGMVKDVTHRGEGEELLYLSPNESMITIYKKGYKPLEIILANNGIKLESGRVFRIEITGDKQEDLIPINIVRNQGDSDIYIDGEYLGNNQKQQVLPGKHIIEIKKSGYETIVDTIIISKTNTLFNFNMQSVEPIVVSINSNPLGAKIIIDAIEKGNTNKQTFLYPGSYTLRLSKPNYLDIDDTIQVSKSGNNIFNYSLIKNTGTLQIITDPIDAILLINKEKYAPNADINLSPGRYKVEISKENYYESEEVVEIKRGDNINKSFVLKPKTGSLQFTVEPSNANVKLLRDGETIEIWEGLKYLKELLIGKYQYVIYLDGYYDLNGEITIEENKISYVNESLIKSSSLSDYSLSDSNIPASSSNWFGFGGTPEFHDRVDGISIGGSAFKMNIDLDNNYEINEYVYGLRAGYSLGFATFSFSYFKNNNGEGIEDTLEIKGYDVKLLLPLFSFQMAESFYLAPYGGIGYQFTQNKIMNFTDFQEFYTDENKSYPVYILGVNIVLGPFNFLFEYNASMTNKYLKKSLGLAVDIVLTK